MMLIRKIRMRDCISWILRVERFDRIFRENRGIGQG